MKSWYDLSKNEQKKLKREFNSKKALIDFRLFLYTVVIIFAFLVIMKAYIFNLQNNYGSVWDETSFIIMVVILIIFLTLAIANSIHILKHEKHFTAWLETKEIKK